MKDIKERIIILAFFLPLILIGLLYILKEPDTVSEAEKRTLQQLPTLELGTLLSGQYNSELDRYYTDQLPMREHFIASDQELTSQMSTLFGLNPVQLISSPGGQGADLGLGENLGNEGKDLVTFPTLDDTTETDEPSTGSESISEPQPGETSIEDPTSSETSEVPSEPSSNVPDETSDDSTSDSKPTETTIETKTPSTTESSATTTVETAPPTTPATTVDTGVVQMSGGILLVGDRAVEVFYSSEAVISSYANLINQVANTASGAQVYSLVAPTAAEFYAPEGYRQGSSRQETAIQTIYGRLNGNIKTVPAYQAIAPHVGDYLYFRSDHHWTGLGAYYAYRGFAQAAGITPLGLSEMEYGRIPGDFLGTLYSWAGQPKRLKDNPDYVDYWRPKVEATGYAFTDASMSAGYAIDLVKRDVNSGNKYLAFTEGDHGLARFDTSVKNGRRIMVIKESYGNAMVPYLAAHYEQVYVFDPRKGNINLADFVSKQQIQDILVVNYSLAIGNNGWKQALQNALR